MHISRAKWFTTKVTHEYYTSPDDILVLTTEDIDIFKKWVMERYKAGLMSYGKYRNLLTSINVFFEYILEKKRKNGELQYKKILDHDGTEKTVGIFSLSTGDIEKFFEDLIVRVKKHTFEVYAFNIKYTLRKIVKNKRLGHLEKYIDPEVFDTKEYLLAKHKYFNRRGRKKNTYLKYDKSKFVSLEDIKDALTYLGILRKSFLEGNAKIRWITFERTRIATALLIFTGARGTEIINLTPGDINFSRGYIEIRRNKLSEEDENKRTTIFPLHPFLAKVLKTYIEDYEIEEDDWLLGNWEFLDKHIKLAFTPKLRLNLQGNVIRINGREYQTDKAIITVRKFRKFWDNYAEANGMDARYKNYLLGRKVGIDMEHYVSQFYNTEVYKKIRNEYIKVFGDLDKKLEKQLKEVFSS